MATVFLIGGTGNHLFQFTRAGATDRFSYAFLSGVIPRALNWTRHGRLFDFPKAGLFATLAGLVALAIDLPLARLTGVSLFSRIDLRALKSEPVFIRMAQIGYFQRAAVTRPIDELRSQIEDWRARAEAVSVAMHVRGGDVLAYQAKGTNPYGVLPGDYYRSALEQAGVGGRVTVFTDDRERVARLFADLGLGDYRIDDGPLDDMIAGCSGAGTFIACNSTLSYWILQLRGPARRSLAPAPFTSTLGIDLPDYVEGIPVVFE